MALKGIPVLKILSRVDNGITYAKFHLKSNLHKGIQKSLMQKEC